jgi:hypothetical protein
MRPDEILGLPHLSWGFDNTPGLYLVTFELLFWLLVSVLTFVLLRWRPRFLEKAELRIGYFSRKTKLWLVGFGALVILVRTAMLPWVPVPAPAAHDEFSYLLASDTFASGRLTNPPTPFWRHFESFHINVLPTYQSMYYPAQGLALAVGQKLTRVPWVGVLLTTALMCSAIYWMLLGWLPPSWAWLGGAFSVVRYGIFSYWINSYFGGSVPALGGALVLGALPRLRRRIEIKSAIIFALGLLILANSRPLEGFLFSLPLFLGALLAIRASKNEGFTTKLKRLAPACVLLIAGFSWMLYYNWRGTGNPFLVPYVLNYNAYHVSKPFMYQGLRQIPTYTHEPMRAFYVFHEMGDVLRLKFDGPLYFIKQTASVYYGFYLWPLLLLVAPGIWAMWNTELRIVLISLLLVCAESFSQIWPAEAHYLSPVAGAAILIVLFSLRHIRSSNREVGPWISRAIVLVMALWMISPITEKLLNPFDLTLVHQKSNGVGIDSEYRGYELIPMEIRRARIEADLESRPGKHLVIVHHPYHDVPIIDWVYNGADLDRNKVVWARDMGYVKNRALIDHYHDRQVWYVDRGDLSSYIWPYDVPTTPWRLALESKTPLKNQSASLSSSEPIAGSVSLLAVSKSEQPTDSKQ